ncbi:hypothetical protein CA603_45405 [Paraburkholderia hospita]|nr:hypothetical protein CA603_45405 [Paraburkholderia hospita]
MNTLLIDHGALTAAIDNSRGCEVAAPAHRNRTPYQLLKDGPALALAGEPYERPDIHSVAILGYN